MSDNRKLLIAAMALSIPILGIVGDIAPEAFVPLIIGGAAIGVSAVIAKSPIGEAISARIRKGNPLKEQIADMIRDELRSEHLRALSRDEEQKLQTEFPEGLVAIMFTDMEGFTEYVERGDDADYQVLRRHNQVIREAVEHQGGRIVKSNGDGFMIASSSVRRALLAAVTIQERFQSYNRTAGEKEQIRVRIGLDAGEPLKQGDDYIGRAVNLAARITAAARPDQVFISETVKQLVGPLSGLQYIDRETHRLKGFSERQHLYEVARIEALAHPLDSEVEKGLADLEKQVREEI
jgi:class 3 adenylate cyclase